MKRFIIFLLLVVLVFNCKHLNNNRSFATNRNIAYFNINTSGKAEPVAMLYNNGLYHIYYSIPVKKRVDNGNIILHSVSDNLITWTKGEVVNMNKGNSYHGCIITDVANVTGLGSIENPVMIGIFISSIETFSATEKSIKKVPILTWSIDNGKTWNISNKVTNFPTPLIENPQDPSIVQYRPTRLWIMSLIVANKIYFYSSTNLYYWNYESSFDPDFYSEELIWEKASLVSLSDEIHWGILLDFKSTSSGEQSEGTIYYTGTFNGHTFTKQSQMPYLLDYGNNISNSLICELPDERKLDLIWMNTVSKRYLRKNRIMISSFAIPRQLSIDFDGQNLVLNQSPVMELEQFHCKETEIIRSVISDNFISIPIYYITTPVEIILSFNTIEINRWNFPSQFGIRFWNKKDEYMTFGYDTSFRFYFIDKSGLISSSLDHTNSLLKIPFNHSDSTIDFHIVLTNNTAEFYAEKGKLVLTENYWTENPFNKISFYVVDGKIELKAGRINELLFK